MSIIWSKSDRYDSSKSAVTTWVYTIARNKKVDFFRKNAKIDVNDDDIREFLYENSDEVIVPNETSVIELADGRIMFNIRNESTNFRRRCNTSSLCICQ